MQEPKLINVRVLGYGTLCGTASNTVGDLRHAIYARDGARNGEYHVYYELTVNGSVLQSTALLTAIAANSTVYVRPMPPKMEKVVLPTVEGAAVCSIDGIELEFQFCHFLSTKVGVLRQKMRSKFFAPSNSAGQKVIDAMKPEKDEKVTFRDFLGLDLRHKTSFTENVEYASWYTEEVIPWKITLQHLQQYEQFFVLYDVVNNDQTVGDFIASNLTFFRGRGKQQLEKCELQPTLCVKGAVVDDSTAVSDLIDDSNTLPDAVFSLCSVPSPSLIVNAPRSALTGASYDEVEHVNGTAHSFANQLEKSKKRYRFTVYKDRRPVTVELSTSQFIINVRNGIAEPSDSTNSTNTATAMANPSGLAMLSRLVKIPPASIHDAPVSLYDGKSFSFFSFHSFLSLFGKLYRFFQFRGNVIVNYILSLGKYLFMALVLAQELQLGDSAKAAVLGAVAVMYFIFHHDLHRRFTEAVLGTDDDNGLVVYVDRVASFCVEGRVWSYGPKFLEKTMDEVLWKMDLEPGPMTDARVIRTRKRVRARVQLMAQTRQKSAAEVVFKDTAVLVLSLMPMLNRKLEDKLREEKWQFETFVGKMVHDEMAEEVVEVAE